MSYVGRAIILQEDIYKIDKQEKRNTLHSCDTI